MFATSRISAAVKNSAPCKERKLERFNWPNKADGARVRDAKVAQVLC